jgi:hypothetical protein
MKEAMRLHPGVSYPLERLVPEGGADLCGQKLREGTVVGINPVVIHHNKEIFGDDAAVFRPERWLGVNEEQLKLMDRTLLTVSPVFLLLEIAACVIPSNTDRIFIISLGLEHVLALERIFLSWKWASLFHRFYVNLIYSGRPISLIGLYILTGSRDSQISWSNFRQGRGSVPQTRFVLILYI